MNKGFFTLTIFLIFQFMSFSQVQLSKGDIKWNDENCLKWEHFKGTPLKLGDFSGEVFCQVLSSFNKPNALSKVTTEVVAVFYSEKSWIHEEQKNKQILSYFQGIFNIYEIHARKLRKDFQSTKFGLDPTSIFNEKYQHNQNELIDMFNKYRVETELGVNTDQLNKWNKKLLEELKNLEKYK